MVERVHSLARLETGDQPAPSSRTLPLAALADIATTLGRTARVWYEQLPAHPVQRSGLRVIATGDYEVWLLRWPPRTSVSPHDHGGSAGAFVVVSGEVEEVRWRGAIRRSRLVGPGEVVTIDRGVAHDVLGGPDLSVTLHVYSPPLASMSYYDEFGLPVDNRPIDEIWSTNTAQTPHPAGGR
jgi:mannose-6-phosphate isomerase-like protein (cupin superfamily)